MLGGATTSAARKLVSDVAIGIRVKLFFATEFVADILTIGSSLWNSQATRLRCESILGESKGGGIYLDCVEWKTSL